jgi:WD repeat-containing protein 59
VCFSRVPPRIIHNPLNELSTSPSVPSRPKNSASDSVPRLFKSPALISDAVRRLAVASHDHTLSAAASVSLADDGDNILHIMTNLLSFSRLKQRRPSASESNRALDDAASYRLLQTRLSTIALRDESHVVNIGREMASEHIFLEKDPVLLCAHNAEVAQRYGRIDHVRILSTLRMLFETSHVTDAGQSKAWGTNPLTYALVKQLYEETALEKDVQLLAVFSIALLKVYQPAPPSSRPFFLFKYIDSLFSLSSRCSSPCCFTADSYTFPSTQSQQQRILYTPSTS